MTEEQLEIATDIKKRMDKLDEEIYLIMGIMPSIRSNLKGRSIRGVLRKLRIKNLVIPKAGYEEEIELSNEDCRALVDIRTAEKEALQQVLTNIKS